MPGLLEKAIDIWSAGVEAVKPENLIENTVAHLGHTLSVGSREFDLNLLGRIVVVGAGKAGAAMAAAVERGLGDRTFATHEVVGWVNVPADTIAGVGPLRRIALHPARNTPENKPTPAGVAGTQRILELVRSCGPNDICICLISGGGSALMPATVPGITLEHKQAVTKLLASAGATINELNAVRKHLSAVKGGRLAAEFKGQAMISLIISDVVGDPLDVIASGPTSADPTTFADALGVLDKFHLADKVPPQVLVYLREGAEGKHPETLKTLPANIENRILGSNKVALEAAELAAEHHGYRVLNLGSYIEGETRHVAGVVAGMVRGIKREGDPFAPPACILIGGETTVTLCPEPGKGGRNTEFVLAAAAKLGADDLDRVFVLSGGTDGEDGPTDAAGAWAGADLWRAALAKNLCPSDHLCRNDSYSFFEAAGGLLKTGPTHTNVMDLRVILIDD